MIIFRPLIKLLWSGKEHGSLSVSELRGFLSLIPAEVKIGIYHIQNFYNIVSNKIIMAENIYHLESKRVENSVFSQEIGGENGISSKKRRSGDFGIFSNSTV